MKLLDILKTRKKTFSFEFFPPKTPEGEQTLFETISQLKKLRPAFVSVTYGAMGTTRENTVRLVTKIKKEIGLEAAAHLTCVGHTRDEILNVLERLKKNHIENIVALRGDPPKGETEFKPVPNGFQYACELVSFIKSQPAFKDSFSLAVAGYPECHVECKDKKKDLEHLKRKVDSGADAVITQLFFDNQDYFDFVDRARKSGIAIPIIPGIMPITHGKQIQKFAGMCGCRIPETVEEAIRKYDGDNASIEAYGIEYAVQQCQKLLAGGIPGLHFYTLNKSKATQKIYEGLNLANRV